MLKLLQESYLGKVKMIYIDPPYNTGHDFIYNDRFEMDEQEYNQQIGLFDEEENRNFRENNESNPRFHSDWCSMMYARLLVARNLLASNGVLFISIDDNEVHDLRKMCDNAFGAANFVGCAGRISKKANNQGNYWAPNFDYLLTYAKNVSELPSFFGGINYSAYNQVEQEGSRKGEKYQLVRLYMTSLDPMRGCTNQRYYIQCPDGSFIIPPGSVFPDQASDGATVVPQSGQDKVWRWSYQTYLEKKDQIVIRQGKSSNVVGVNGAETKWNAFTKTYLNDVISKMTATPNSFIEDHINQNATHELKQLGIPFAFAKPTSLIKYLLNVCQISGDDIVMDFFSGSATVADAVVQYNAENTQNVKYICVQLPEECSQESDEFKAGYKNICEIGKERIRRAGAKIKSEAGLMAQTLDTGFRVFKLDETNMKDVFYSAEEYTQTRLDDMISNIKEDRTDLDLLYGCLLEWGLPLSLPHVTETIEDCNVHTVNGGDLIACFDEDIPESVIKKIAQRKPLRVVFRDSSFASSPEKINVTEIFKLMAPGTSVRVI